MLPSLTTRLVLRDFTPDDAPFMLGLVNEPAYVRFIADRGIRTTEDAAAYLRAGPMASYAEHGFGLWHVSLRGTGDAIGKCGLLKRDWLPDPDLGFAFLEQHWRQGYAREAAAATLEYAHTTLGLRRVLATTHPENDSSMGLLRKLGFTALGAVTAPGYNEPARLFAADLPAAQLATPAPPLPG